MEQTATSSGLSPLFHEKQRFNQWLLWLLLFGLFCIPMVGIIQQLVFHKPFGSKPLSDTGLLLFGAGMALFCLFFRMMFLKTTIDSRCLHIQFYPFLSRKYNWSEIREARVIKYGFVGYGIKLWTPHGTVYNISGNWGLAVEFKNGKKMLVGTRVPEELSAVLKKIRG